MVKVYFELNDKDIISTSKYFHLCGCNVARSGNKATEI